MRQTRKPLLGRSLDGRPWYRLHLSTWVVLFVVASVLFLAIVPGKLNVSHSASIGIGDWSFNVHVLREHGWPLVYVVREYPAKAPSYSSTTVDPANWTFSASTAWEPYVDWDNLPSAWALGQEVQSFRPWALAADVAVAGCLLLLLGAAFEWRRRHRGLLQFSLRELLLFVLLVSSALGWLIAQREQYKLLVDRVSDLDAECDGYDVSALPHWVRTVVGDDRLFPLGANRPLYLVLEWRPSDHEQIRWLVEHYPAEVLLEVDPLTWEGEEQEGLERIGELRRLEALLLRHPDQGSLALLPELRNLRLLVVAVFATDRPLACLDGLEELEVLVLEGLQISDATMLQIARMRKLRRLSLPEAALTDAGLARLACLSKLEVLNLEQTEITDTGLSHLRRLPRLEILDIFSAHVTDVGLSHLKAMPRLQWVDLTFTEVTDAGAAELARARPALQIDRSSQKADLAKLQASIDRVRQGKSTSLRFGAVFLSTGGFTLGDSRLEMLCGLENLEHLDVWSQHVTDDGLRHLGDLKSLKSVELDCPRIRGPGLRHLARLPQLRKLGIVGTRIRGSEFENLTALEHLECLTVDSTQIDEVAIEELQRLPKLKELRIEVWSEGPPLQPLVEQLNQALPNCRIEQR